MKEKLQTKFATRQYMISDTFELYYYSTVDVPGVKEHTHTHYEFYLFLEVGLLAKDKLTTNPCTAESNPLFCNGCASCEKVCPYGAISYEDRQVNDHGIRETRHVAVVNGALCHGCGACTVACPSGAMDLKGFSNRQILAEVDAICR